jgi:hypothetical protein
MMTHQGPLGECGEQAVGGAGATRVYMSAQRDQLFLMPVSMRDWLDEGHLAWFVIDVVSELDTTVLHHRPAAGRAARRMTRR